MRRIKFSGILKYKQTPTPINVRKSELVLINKKKKKRTHHLVDLAVPAKHRVKIKERGKRKRYLDHARELTKRWKIRVTVITMVVKCALNGPHRLGKGTGRFRNQMASGDHPNYIILGIGQNTEKSPGELRDLLPLRLQ